MSLGPRSRSRLNRPIVMAVKGDGSETEVVLFAARPVCCSSCLLRVLFAAHPVCCSSCLLLVLFAAASCLLRVLFAAGPVCCSVKDLSLTHAAGGGTGFRALPASLLFIWKFFQKRYCFYFFKVFNRGHEQHTQTSPQQQQPQREPDARHVRGPPPTGRTRQPLQTGTVWKVTRDGNDGRTGN